MTMYLARHAPTPANRQGLILGSRDWPLAGIDLANARILADRLAEKHLVRAFSSPLSRALETARVLAGDVPVEAVPGLTELSAGVHEGRPRAEILHRPGPLRATPMDRPPGGESYADATPRVAAAFGSLLQCARPGPVLVVGHSVVNRLILALFLESPLEAFLTFTQPHAVILTLAPDRTLAWFDATGREGGGLPGPEAGK